MNFKILISILMNEELVKEITFQSSPNFLFLMKTGQFTGVSLSKVLA